MISSTVHCRWYANVMNDYIDKIESTCRSGLYRMLSDSNYLVSVVEVLQNEEELEYERSPEVVFIIQRYNTNQGFFNGVR